jgi:4-amino-4-deoxy-L-arabinose transferase-like glycosyltransferase
MNVATKERAPAQESSPRATVSSWTERVALLLAAATALRLVVASTLGLTDTEAYYVQWARFPDWSYYDHPPLVAWTTWLVQRLSTAPWTVRVGPVLYAAAFGSLLYRLATRLFSPRAGFLAVAIVTAMPAFALIGVVLNPEGLLAPLWILFLLLLADLPTADEPWRPLAIGAVIGVAFLAKYTAILAVPVTLLYVAGSPSTRRWLRRPSLYLGGVVALAITTPVILWNHAHDWPSLRLHLSERLARPAGETLGVAVERVAFGQLVLFHPLILPALLVLTGYATWRAFARRDERHRLLATASVPVLAFLLVVMVRAGDSEPHWTMVAYASLAIVAGGVLDESQGALRRVAHRYLQASIALSVAAAALYVVHLRSPVLLQAVPSYRASADPVNETLGWRRVRRSVASHVAALGPGTVVAGAHNVLCGHLGAATDDSPPVYCPSPRRTEFDFVGRRAPPAGVPVVFVNSDRYPDDPALALPSLRCVEAEEVQLERGDRVLGRYHIHECVPDRLGAL